MAGSAHSHQIAEKIINIGTNYGPVKIDTQEQRGLTAVHSIPSSVEDFLGHEQDLEDIGHILQRVERGAGAICGIWGMPGIGKSQFAYKAAHQFASLFPNGQILIELRGTKNNPITSLAALQLVIRAFEPEAKLPENEAQVRAIYQSLLHGKHVLILADDAMEASQVRPLLPPPGCAIVITSRRRFALPGLHPTELKLLSPSHAEQFLLNICPRVGENASRLARLCGYLPLALRISASLLLERDIRSVTRYIEDLEQERLKYLSRPDELHDPQSSVRASIRLSYDDLENSCKSALCQLGIFSASFDLAAAKAIVSITDKTDIDSTMEQLRTRSLLEWDTRLERFNLHDLIRQYVLEQWDKLGDLLHLHIRYAHHYAKVASTAQTILQEGTEDILKGLQLFDTERVHIDSGWSWVQRQEMSEIASKLLMEFAEATVYIGRLRYDRKTKRIPQFESALLASIYLNNIKMQCFFHQILGNTYFELDDHKAAIDYCNKALNIAQQSDDKLSEFHILNNMSVVYAAMKNYRSAHDCSLKCLSIAKDFGDKSLEFKAMRNMLNIYNNISYDKGDIEEILEINALTIKVMQESGDREGEGHALKTVGTLYQRLGRFERAIEFYKQALAISEERGDLWEQSLNLGAIGFAYIAIDDNQSAISSFNQCVQVARQIGHKESEYSALFELGMLYYQIGSTYRARDYFNQSLILAQELKDLAGEADTLKMLAGICVDLEEWPQAVTYLKRNLNVVRELGSPHHECYMLYYLGYSYDMQEEWHTAIKYYKNAHALAHKLRDKEFIKSSAEKLALAYASLGYEHLEPGKWHSAIEYYKEAYTIAKTLGDKDIEQESAEKLAVAHNAIEQHSQAIIYLREALSIARKLRKQPSEVQLLNNLGISYMMLKQFRKSLPYLKQALTLVRKINDPHREYQILRHLTVASFGSNDTRTAITFCEQCLVIAGTNNDKRYAEQLLQDLKAVAENYEGVTPSFRLDLL